MNSLLFFFFSIMFFVGAKGQSSFPDAMKMGDDEFKKKEYRKAINFYLAAEAFDASKKNEVKDKVNQAFNEIEKLRNEAEAAKKRALIEKENAEKANRETAMAKIESDSAKNKAIKSDSVTKIALAKAQKLIDAFYFHKDRFALVYKEHENRFFFIDENGDEIRRLGRWDKAEQFNKIGLAKVGNIDWGGAFGLGLSPDTTLAAFDFLMDTSGKRYAIITDKGQLRYLNSIDGYAVDYSFTKIKDSNNLFFGDKDVRILILSENKLESLPPEIRELKNLRKLDLSKNYLKSLPSEIGELKYLTGLYLSKNYFTSLSPEIGKLNNLTELDLTGNQLDSLPKEIGELKNLTELYLRNNHLEKLPKELGQLKNLTTLDLANDQNILAQIDPYALTNSLKSLPEEIGKLKKLKRLFLTGNSIPKTEIEKIRKLLPNCKIYTE